MTAAASSALAGRVGRGLGWSTASNLMMRLGNLLVSILMARLIAPEQFGVFAVAMTVWSVLGTLAEFGLGTDLVRARDLARRIPTVTTIGFVTTSALAVGMALSAQPIAGAFQSPESTDVIRLMSLTLAMFGFSIVPTALLQREFRQGTLFVVNGSAMLTSAATMTTLALLDFGPAALAWGQIASQLVIILGAYAATRHRLRLGFDRAIARESLSFCMPLAVANVLSWLLLGIDNLVVARVTSPADLGLYVLAFNISSWPMSAIGQAVRVVALPAFSQIGNTSAQSRALVAVSGPVAALCALMGVTLATLATPVVVLLYGERWREAGTALAGLAVFGALRVLFDLLATFLISLGATRSVLVVQVWWIVAMVPAMVAGVTSYGLLGAGWAHVVVGLAAVLPAYMFCLHLAHVDWAGFLRGLVLPVVAVVPSAIACMFLTNRVDSPVGAVLLGGTTVLLLYVAPMAPWLTRQVRQLRGQPTVAPTPMSKVREAS